ncbi:MAG: hypothetical protein U0R80_00435 [Nocardioidaceae bacterium]
MRAVLIALACTVGLVAGPAQAAGGLHVKPLGWHVYTPTAGLHTVKNTKTFKACATDPVNEIYLKGKVTGAKKGKKFVETWRLDGVKQFTTDAKWDKSGSFTDYFGYAPGATIPNGTWTVTLTRSGTKFGSGKVTLATKVC